MILFELTNIQKTYIRDNTGGQPVHFAEIIDIAVFTSMNRLDQNLQDSF